ncbi:DUF461 domain-containing protein [Streptomyces nitrosporeus]|uniref:DUF461 domain-containing protein n=1 Tax=Streptomyces nitrosporeus TaxID=28894 RepID=A0A5J6FB04_9ACTN|nr:DUF461 domain-containing protein [Streptomyces nitrosporeus]QEU73183.1 DUF461 domain-containing protein [Streptomyces nitrosporeus]GGZ09907.1 lipoprotein [Streptomyces nitrosporeus]
MSRSLRHGALAATAIVFSIVSLSACGAGNDAATLKVRPDNASTALDQIKVQNVNVITQPEREAEGPAVIAATLFNDGTKQETLESITLPGTDTTVKLTPAEGGGPVVVPAGGRVILGGEGNASAVIEDGREATQDGNVQNVAFTFSETGEVSLGALVVPATHFFKDFGPSALPSPEPTPSQSASGSPSPDASAEGTGAEGATQTETGENASAEDVPAAG